MIKIIFSYTVLFSMLIFSACQSETSTSKVEEAPEEVTVIDNSPIEHIDTVIQENEPLLEEETTETISEEVKPEQSSKTAPTKKSSTKTEVPKPKSTTSQSNPTVVKEEKPSPSKSEKPKVVTAPTSSPKVEPKKPTTEVKKEVTPTKIAFSHNIWDGLLKKHVSSTGKVNYTGFKKDKQQLDAYLALLSENAPKSNASRNDQIAFWINAYNAFTVDLIIDNYPISSILKLDDGKTWHVKRITIGGKKYALNDIEKNILIGRFKEGRIHFAINCAAQSCPPLKNKAWNGKTLNADLDRASKDFINNSKYNQFAKKTAKLSRIFEWYSADFGDVTTFINKYANTPIGKKTKVSYNEYDWDLNK